MPGTAQPLLGEFFRYNAWANQQLLEAGAALTREQLTTSMAGTYGSIYDTLVHLVRAEAAYLHRLTGERLAPPFAWDDQPGLAEIRAYAGQVSTVLVQAAERAQPTDIVQQEWQGEMIRYQASVILIQAINHGVEHRTNITTILSQLGVTPPGVDGWSYFWGNLDQLAAA